MNMDETRMQKQSTPFMIRISSVSIRG